MFARVQPRDGHWVSQAHGDVYHGGAGTAAWEEHDHVFLAPLRDVLASEHPCVAEIGFGFGVNFLLTWAAFESVGRGHLHYLGFEKAPVRSTDFECFHRHSPQPTLSAHLARVLPPVACGWHRLELSPRVTLDLYYGMAEQRIEELPGRAVDGWLLDGFAPDRNPGLWSADFLKALAMRARPGAVLATFSVARMVRDNLKHAGFVVHKRPGFGRKRHALIAHLEHRPAVRESAPWFAQPGAGQDRRSASALRIGIVGGGIAGATLAWMLRPHAEVTVLEAQARWAMNAPPIALSTPTLGVPALDGQPDRYTQLTLSGYLGLERLALAEGIDGLKALRVRHHMTPERQACMLTHPWWDEGWLTAVEGGVCAPGFRVEPQRLIASLLTDIPTFVNTPVRRVVPTSEGVEVITDTGAHPLDARSFDAVVLTGEAMAALGFAQGIPLRSLPGTLGQLSMPWEAFCGDGYGVKDDTGLGYGSPASDLEGVAVLKPAVWAGMRTGVPDRRPVVGPAPDFAALPELYPDLHHGRHWKSYPPCPVHPGVWLLGGLGGKGFSTSTVCAAALKGALLGFPTPLKALHPARFAIKALRSHPCA